MITQCWPHHAGLSGGSLWYGFPTRQALTRGSGRQRRCARSPIRHQYGVLRCGSWAGRPDRPDPMWSLAEGRAGRDDGRMQLIQPTHLLRPARGPLFLGTIVGGVLLVGGLGLAWLEFATPIVRGLTPSVVRPDARPAGDRRPRLGPVARRAAVPRDRRGDPAVPRRRGAPPAPEPGGGRQRRSGARRRVRRRTVRSAARRQEHPQPRHWAIRRRRSSASCRTRRTCAATATPGSSAGRTADGCAFENPLERAARDADRIRHWLGGEDRDFIVKVYPAVVVENEPFGRTPACAAITADQIPGWLAALPPQRSLSPDRQADIAERIRSIA